MRVAIDRINQRPIVQNETEDWRAQVPTDIWDVANKEVLKLLALTGLDLQDWLHTTNLDMRLEINDRSISLIR